MPRSFLGEPIGRSGPSFIATLPEMPGSKPFKRDQKSIRYMGPDIADLGGTLSAECDREREDFVSGDGSQASPRQVSCSDGELRMDLGLKGKTALVLGGGGGLGRAIARSLAAEGANVAVAGIGSASIDGTVAELRAIGGKCIGLIWDLADLSVINANILKIESELGPIDILVNNTGGPPPASAADLDPALLAGQFQSMVLSVIAITDRVLSGMKSRGWGRILTSTSSGVIAPIPNLAISNALRLSLVGWSKTLAREVGKEGITVNIVVPGRIATSRVAALDNAKAKREGRSAEEVAAESQGAIPLGRYGKPEEYADVVGFLASERAAYITGSVIRVDGGLIPSI